ncbi:MAG: PilT/PilU family type 4a pilus ATPase [Gemmataceae bacterium]|nr:PilT/PilU family type 4a pilus ATPase [Gemmataceae bacterium]MDW8267415.1 PilT/PilU family type 4a pilus ATPase [Gemmataceae bacterium]
MDLTPPSAESVASARALLEDLLAECARRDASDIHLAPDLPPYMRVHGVLEPQADRPPVTATVLQSLAVELARGFDGAALTETGSLDGALSSRDGARFRFNVFRRGGQLAIALRRLEDRFRSLAELGLAESLYQLCDLPDGLVIVAGPTGAGKSTTLATLLDRINQSRRCHIITIEDPIEYIHRPALALVNQRQVGTDTRSFNDALVASLRQDPDVILVGEIRELNTIRTAITAAETGHLVFTTVHAGDCAGTIERLVSVFPADEQPGIRRQLSLVLRAVIAQHLLVADGPGLAAAREGGGPSGRRRRVVVSEILMVTPAVANLIATAKTAQIYSVMEAGGPHGMQTLEQDLARLHLAQLISETTAMMMARNPQVLRDRIAQLRKSASFHPRTTGGGR